LKHIERLLDNCSKDHILYQAYHNYRNLFWINSFLTHLDTSLGNILDISTRAYNDLIQNKLVAANGESFDKHSLISSLCELCLMNSFITNSDKPESFVYEPKLRTDNNKNVEFSIKIKGIQYNIEVKSPNLSNYYDQLKDKINKYNVVTRFDTRSFGKPEKDDQMPSPSIRVKDFLSDANLKFPISNLPNVINILFIAWDDHTDQPCIEMKHPIHGLLTPNSWYKDNHGRVILFPNIDLIFVSDLYKNIITHLSSGATPLPSSITGVPYFERNSRFNPSKINPFLLPFSRNVLIRPNIDIENEQIKEVIFSIPVMFSDQSVQVIDEDYVGRHASDIKISFKF
jgi:hypothetical protein